MKTGCRVHIIKGRNRGVITTYCGMVGWKSNVDAEFDTARGRRFEAVSTKKGATCRQCRKFQ